MNINLLFLTLSLVMFNFEEVTADYNNLTLTQDQAADVSSQLQLHGFKGLLITEESSPGQGPLAKSFSSSKFVPLL